MGNIISYLNEYGDKSFSEVPFGEADALLLAQLSYLKFDGIVPAIAQRERGVTLHEINEKMDPDVVLQISGMKRRTGSCGKRCLEAADTKKCFVIIIGRGRRKRRSFSLGQSRFSLRAVLRSSHSEGRMIR